MNLKASTLLAEFSGPELLQELQGPDVEISGIAPVENCGKGKLIFVDKEEFASMARDSQPAGIVTKAEFLKHFEDLQNTSLLVAKNVGLVSALIRQKYADRDLRETEWSNPHPSSVIHESAHIESNVQIGPLCVIGAGVTIAADCVLMARSIVEAGAKIAEGTIIHTGAVVGYDCQIGKGVVIKSNAVIGSEGFGFAQDERKRSHRVPQIGKVVIEDDVTVGAGCCIDRATFSETRIGRGTKIDNLCHIAHNVVIGEDCILTAGFITAGSTIFGNRVIASGQTGVLDHLHITDDVVLLHRAGVINDIDEPGLYAGLPATPLKEYLRNVSLVHKLSDMRKRIQELEKKE